jgi:hypothetical protein
MRKIFTTVFIFHMVALLYFIISSDMQKPKKKPLHVKTVVAVPHIQEKKVVQAQAAPQSKPKTARPALPAPPAPVKNIPQKENKQTPNKKKQTTATKKTPPVAKKEPLSPNVSHLLQELEETIAKIDQKRDKDIPLKQIEAPKWINSLKIDAIKEISDDSAQVDFNYQDTLIQVLRESLDLPELGEVKMEITLNRDGTVVKLRVLAAESEKNRIYLEKNLCSIKFPPFDINESRKIFVLTFCNE